ncbi:uncharacterized protein F4807DRAFT_456161 [Annulohypoxylon truncatum]|uniref:uncharacterized protein n=1 Tax=Annulohypoxylon truncatum TaxID=327061 RepID=UPI002008AEFA|nr:uncharacterized protein F4807DRAFT_456161 [Annulohypoxylon truncatum]KAI1213609.1 hypothetical protein F4807DRAFT_456161 [Annulohypoxylon truncatum]
MPRKTTSFTEDGERERRAERKRLRTSWRTDATEKDKKAALNMAVGRLGGKKYSWMDQAASTQTSASNAPATSGINGTVSSIGRQSTKDVEKPVAKNNKGDAEKEAEQELVEDSGDEFAKELEDELTKELEDQLAKELEEELTKELGEELMNDIDNTVAESQKASVVEKVDNTIKSHLPTPASSPTQPVVEDEVPVSKASSEGVQPTNEPTKKRKRGTAEEPIAISSREASPIVLSSRDGSPAATPQPPKAKRVKKTPKPQIEEELADELEEAFNEEEEKEELYLILDYAWAFMTI